MIYSMNELCSLRIEDFMQVLLGGSIESVTASPIKKQKVLLNRMRLQWCNQSPTPLTLVWTPDPSFWGPDYPPLTHYQV